MAEVTGLSVVFTMEKFQWLLGSNEFVQTVFNYKHFPLMFSKIFSGAKIFQSKIN
mgnify:CR=1 FL=1